LKAEQVYARAAAILTAGDGVLEVTIGTETPTPSMPYHRRLWIDGRRQLVREEIISEGTVSKSLATDDQVFRRESRGRVSVAPSQFSRCYGSGIAASMLLGCPGSPDGSRVSVEEGTFHGKDVLVLSTESVDSVHRIYLDAETVMPIHLEAEGTSSPGGRFSGGSSFTVRNIERSALPPDFFAAPAIGFVTDNPETEAIGASDIEVFWLGREFSASGVEPLVLRSVSAELEGGHPYRSRLAYARADSPYNAPFLILQVYSRENFVVAPESFEYAVFRGNTVVLFREATIEGKSGEILTPETLEALKQGLQPYESR
jgi:hypothetical protein